MNTDDLNEIRELLVKIFAKYIDYPGDKDLVGIITNIIGEIELDLNIDKQIRLNLKDHMYEIKKIRNNIAHSRNHINDYDDLLYSLQIIRTFKCIKEIKCYSELEFLDNYINKKNEHVELLIQKIGKNKNSSSNIPVNSRQYLESWAENRIAIETLHWNIYGLINFIQNYDEFYYEEGSEYRIIVEDQIENLISFPNMKQKLVSRIIDINERGSISVDDLDDFDEVCIPNNDMYKISVQYLNDLFNAVNDFFRKALRTEIKEVVNDVNYEMKIDTIRTKLTRLREEIISKTKIEREKCILRRTNIDKILKFKIDTKDKIYSYLLNNEDYNADQLNYVDRIIEILKS